jgi:Putative adhesin
MRKIEFRTFLIALTATLLLAATSAWAQSGQDFHWTGKLAPDNVVEIKGVNGQIEAEAGSGDEVEVTAEKSGSDADDVKIVAVPHGDGITICAIYPRAGSECTPGKGWHTENVHGNHARVHFHVRMPANLRFSGYNINGDVSAENIGRVVIANTVNGSVRVSTKAWAQVSSVNGSVEATMGSADWSGKLQIDSVNGSIHLTLPDNFNSDVKFSSVNGRLHTDFPMTVEGSMGGRHMEGRIGSGGRELVVETVNGSVELRKGSM